MNWDFILWLLRVLAVLFAILAVIIKITGGYAPGWQLRCTNCGHTADAAMAGLVRWGARSIGKRIRGNCIQCGGRTLALERKPSPDAG